MNLQTFVGLGHSNTCWQVRLQSQRIVEALALATGWARARTITCLHLLEIVGGSRGSLLLTVP